MKKYVLLDHTADIKYKVNGNTLSEIFENIIFAVSEYLSSGEKVQSKVSKVIEVRGHDKESLMYNFIEEILFLVDSENFIPSKSEVLIRGNNLRAELFGDKASDYPINHIKAPTYNDMAINKQGNEWQAIIVLDV